MTKTSEKVAVEQVDREAAASNILQRLKFQHGGEQPWMDASTMSMRMGEQDDHWEVQAFARHRLRTPEPAGVERALLTEWVCALGDGESVVFADELGPILHKTKAFLSTVAEQGEVPARPRSLSDGRDASSEAPPVTSSASQAEWQQGISGIQYSGGHGERPWVKVEFGELANADAFHDWLATLQPSGEGA